VGKNSHNKLLVESEGFVNVYAFILGTLPYQGHYNVQKTDLGTFI